MARIVLPSTLVDKMTEKVVAVTFGNSTVVVGNFMRCQDGYIVLTDHEQLVETWITETFVLAVAIHEDYQKEHPDPVRDGWVGADGRP